MAAQDLPHPSALQLYIENHTSSSSPHEGHLQHLALQIKHNLQYQHRWTDLQVHHYRPIQDDKSSVTGKRKRTPLPRPLISGLPPQRLYVHPDEQIAMLQEAKKSGIRIPDGTRDDSVGTNGDGSAEPTSAGADADGATDGPSVEELAALTKVEPEREWVLPTHLKEAWSLRRFGEVFDAIEFVPPDVSASEREDDLEEHENDVTPATTDGKINPWRTKKRVLLATLDDDSTVVYYIVHDGVVKPRQN